MSHSVRIARYRHADKKRLFQSVFENDGSADIASKEGDSDHIHRYLIVAQKVTANGESDVYDAVVVSEIRRPLEVDYRGAVGVNDCQGLTAQ